MNTMWTGWGGSLVCVCHTSVKKQISSTHVRAGDKPDVAGHTGSPSTGKAETGVSPGLVGYYLPESMSC